MQVTQDDSIFQPLAEEFVLRYIKKVGRFLHNSGFVPFDARNPSYEDKQFLFELCFIGILEFEEQSGFKTPQGNFFPRVGFEVDPVVDEPPLYIGRTLLHGLLDEPLMSQALEQLRDEVCDTVLG